MAEASAEKKQDDDQSMEEILQSIRRIIAEDDEDGAVEKPAAEPSKKVDAEEASAAKGSDVLELTDMVTEEGAVVNVSEEESSQEVDNSHDILADIDHAISPADSDGSSSFDSLISGETASTASAMLKGLKKPAESVVESQYMPPLRSGTTIEDLVIEALRPLLKSWIDQNLTGIVEKVVEKEVKKLTE